MKRFVSIIAFLSIKIVVLGQSGPFIYDNHTYKTGIKTVQCYNTKKEQSFPIMALGSNDQLVFSFDDLGKANQNYSYTLEHCTADWKPSRISPSDYLETFYSDRFLDYRISFNTIQKYTHYEITLPNDQIKPKLAGNYLLKVYENDNIQQPVISQRIYITNNQVTIGAEVVPSSQVSDRFSNQKINFTIFHNFQIPNPYMDVKAVVMQNFDPLTARVNSKPAFVRNGSLVYNDLTTNDFPGGNEFRKFDFRSLRYKATNVQDIYRDSVNTIVLYQDRGDLSTKYANQFDEDGNFFIRSQDGRDPRTEGDYANVMFTLKAMPPSASGDVYVVGRFNNYILSDENKLKYFPDRKVYYGNIQLKQGLYDYKYIWVAPPDAPDGKVFEGSFFETENNYQVLVYYRRPGGRWDELVGYTNVNSNRR